MYGTGSHNPEPGVGSTIRSRLGADPLSFFGLPPPRVAVLARGAGPWSGSRGGTSEVRLGPIRFGAGPLCPSRSEPQRRGVGEGKSSVLPFALPRDSHVPAVGAGPGRSRQAQAGVRGRRGRGRSAWAGSEPWRVGWRPPEGAQRWRRLPQVRAWQRDFVAKLPQSDGAVSGVLARAVEEWPQ